MDSTAGRLSTLRKCVVELESKDKHATDYELHSMALDLYHEELGELLRELCIGEDIVKNRFEKDEEKVRSSKSGARTFLRSVRYNF